MGSEAKKILEQALALPSNERAELLQALGDSLETEATALSPEWTAELEARIAAVERGDSHVIPADEFEARMLRALSAD